MIKYWLGILVFSLGAIAQALEVSSGSYPFPYNEPLLPSVTFALIRPSTDHLQKRKIAFKPERKKIPVLGEFGDLRYGAYVQRDRNAPLVIYLSGTGGGFDGNGNKFMSEDLYQAGFNVISMDSAFAFTYIIGASRDGHPGYIPDDSEDRYEILKLVLDDFRSTYGTGFGDVHIVGLSLGGLEAVFISHLDSISHRLGIKRTILINPPVDLHHSMRLLDVLFSAGDKWSFEHKERLMGYVIGVALDNMDNPNAITQLHKIVKLNKSQIVYLIGRNFRELLRDTIISSQQVYDQGILKGPYTPLLRSGRSNEAFQFSFAQYAERFLIPMVKKRHPDLKDATVEQFFANSSMTALDSFVRANPNLFVITNFDDLIISKKDLTYLKDALSDRLILFPFGGHCGNVWHPMNRATLIKLLKAS